MVHASSKCLDRAKQSSSGSVVHGAAALPVLLIVNIETDGVGLSERV
jgi:hypothetical protein